MPIKDRTLYPSNWNEIADRIRERDGQRCKFCRAPNLTWIMRLRGDPAHWETYAEHFGTKSDPEQHNVDDCDPIWCRPIRVILTVAHLDQDPTNNHHSNLAALCQRCHLQHDREANKNTSRRTRDRKRGQPDLVDVLEERRSC